jgi:radical SAM superfamily enzyme YgiQ (UPF0313 family)
VTGLRAPGSVLLVSCYELGHQPFAIASAWAQLEGEGFGVDGVDASLDRVDVEAMRRAELVAISVPMHTALRLGVAIASKVREERPDAHVCLFGLYASMNAARLLETVADSVIGGEFESALVGLARALAARSAPGAPLAATEVPGVRLRPRPGAGAIATTEAQPILERLAFQVPRRDRLPALSRYAELIGPAEGERRTVGYVEASRGCLHECRHCPVTAVYEGRFFVVPRDVVLADIAQQVSSGAQHITFGDPDFFNGVGHSMAIVRAMAAQHPGLSFDVTTKVENLLRHRERLPELAQLGCAFVVSAFESLADRVLAELDKGHTRSDAFEALRLCRAAGLAVRPTLVAFTPWTSLDDYIELCDFVADQELVDHVDPIQLAIRLLLPPGSALLRHPAERPWLGELAPDQFGYRWTHPDPRMDALHAQVTAAVEQGAREAADAAETFARIRALAYAAAGRSVPLGSRAATRTFVPRLTEPWFCCAEPSAELLEQVAPHAGELADCCRPQRDD